MPPSGVLENRFLPPGARRDGGLRLAARQAPRPEVLAPGGGGNRLLAFEDKPLSYDAWDIDAYYVEKR